MKTKKFRFKKIEHLEIGTKSKRHYLLNADIELKTYNMNAVFSQTNFCNNRLL
jgi:hypothetical protein